MKFKRIGADVDVPALGLVDVKFGDVVDATGDTAISLKSQPDVWEPVPSKTKEN